MVEICKPLDERTGRAGPSVGLAEEMLPKLLDYIIRHHYPHLVQQFEQPEGRLVEKLVASHWLVRYLAFYKELVQRTALMVAEWQCVGCNGFAISQVFSLSRRYEHRQHERPWLDN